MSSEDSAPAPEVRPPAGVPPRKAGYGDLLFRVIILVAVLGSVAMIWWSFVLVLLPRQQQAKDLSLRVSRLSAEVDDLDGQWTQAQMTNVTNQFSQVDLKLFGGQAGVDAWLANLKELAGSLALDVGADFGPPSPQTAGGRTLNVIPATVSIKVQPAGPETKTPSPYGRVLLLGQLLSVENKRADLTELTMDGGTNSINRVALVLNYWAAKEGAP
jgi:hypothetical protein